MTDPSPSETNPQTPRPSSGNRGKLIFAGLAVAAVIAFALARAGGNKTSAAITLVTTDRDDLACASDKSFGRYRCEFRVPGTPWPDAPAPADRLAGYFTIDRTLYVIPGLFEQPALAKRYADEEQRHLTREQRPRFVATCQLKVVDHLKDFQTRWVKNGEWNHQDDAVVATPSDCRIQ